MVISGKLACVYMLFSTFLLTRGQLVGEPCVRDHDEAPGMCEAVNSCKQAREDYRKGIPLSHCGFIGGKLIICCPNVTEKKIKLPSTRTATGSSISELKCREYAKLTYKTAYSRELGRNVKTSSCKLITQLIIGGKKTINGEFPHVAAIGWKKYNEIEFKCGGSLISEKFVLTAAHCITGGSPPTVVRLGDRNIHSKSDGLYEHTIQIKQSIVHEKYERGRNDIAVVELAKKALFSEFIRPACLWQSDETETNYVTTVGWGKTSTGKPSDELLQVTLDIISNEQCQSIWRQAGLRNFTVSDSQICAGDKRGGRDTCSGDSGGGMMVTKQDNKCLFYIVGITSIGLKHCDKIDDSTATAGIYTKVSSYLEWIESKVWK